MVEVLFSVIKEKLFVGICHIILPIFLKGCPGLKKLISIISKPKEGHPLI